MRFSCCLALAAISTAASAQSPRQIDDLVAKAMHRYRVPGVSVAVVKDGKVVVAKGYGVRELGKSDRVTAHTLFGIGSNTKFFTATALALMVEDGRVKWDEPVVTYLPDFAMYDPWVSKEITVRDLLVHRSGLGLGEGDLLWCPETTYTRDEINARLRFLKPATSFRSGFAYDNVLYGVAGAVIERVSGLSWEAFVQTRVLRAAGMRESVSSLPKISKAPDRASPHGDVNGRLAPLPFPTRDVADSAGGIAASAADLTRWLRLHLDGGRPLLKPASERELTTVVTPIPDPTADFFGYALGIAILEVGGHRTVYHNGSVGGYFSEIIMVPDRQIGIAVLSNNGTNAAALVAEAIRDSALGIKRSEARTEIAKSVIVAPPPENKESKLEPLPTLDTLRRFAGDYEDAWYGAVSIVTEGSGLVVRFAHTPAFVGDVAGTLKGRYYIRWRDRTYAGADATMAFEEKDGRVVRASILPASPDTDFSFDFADLDLIRR